MRFALSGFWSPTSSQKTISHVRVRDAGLIALRFSNAIANSTICNLRPISFSTAFKSRKSLNRLVRAVLRSTSFLKDTTAQHQAREVLVLVHLMKKLSFVLTIFSLPLIAANATEQHTVDRSASIIREFRHIPERSIPAHILINARGLAIISVVKAGFILSAKAGEGVVVARTGHGWSGPSFIGTGGAGGGPQIGAQVTDFIIVLNTERAIWAFSKGGNVTLGADLSVAAGPVGRAAEADVTPRAAIYTYSKSKGLFIGASLEGAVIGTRKGANDRYYGQPVSAYDILRGSVAPPAGAANLRAALSGG